MKITSLLENTTTNEQFKVEHGLSLFIETHNHKILFDMGQSDLFSENAEVLGIDLTEVDNQKLECHENKFMISFKKGVAPISCTGGTITLLEEHNEFDTYMVEHKGLEVVITV